MNVGTKRNPIGPIRSAPCRLVSILSCLFFLESLSSDISSSTLAHRAVLGDTELVMKDTSLFVPIHVTFHLRRTL